MMVDEVKKRIVEQVASGKGFFKSQQVGDEDLTFEEKQAIACHLLDTNIPLFMQRYWKDIQVEDLSFFSSRADNYEVKFYMKEIQKYQNSKKKKVCIRNRRYEALKKMVNEGTYFSDAEMKKRNPFLYDQLIGRHMTEEEKRAAYKAQSAEDSFSSFLLNQMERNQENRLFQKQQDEDEAAFEEEDDDSEEEEYEASNKCHPVTQEEKSLLRSEFTNIMYESFLEGKDQGFDYSTVDENVEYDSVRQRDLDEEEKYFDEDTSDSIDEMESTN